MLSHGYPDSKVHGADIGPTWGRRDPGGPHVGHVNLVILVLYELRAQSSQRHRTHYNVCNLNDIRN